MADDSIAKNEMAADAAAIDKQNTTEPATTHDVGTGAGIGAVGGAVVGALAGGPVGAIIGAVAGGAASAGAVDAVDKHDHDYVETVTKHDTKTLGTGDKTYSSTDNDSSATDNDYRRDFDTRYAGTDERYEDHASAYEHGNIFANDPQYQNSDWDTVEPALRTHWEGHQPGTWDRVKGSVRQGWDRTNAKV